MRATWMVCSLLVSFSLFAQSNEEKAVAGATEALRQAMVDGNREALTKIAMDQLSYGHSSGFVENKSAFVDNIASGNSDFVSITISDQTISIVNDVAIVRHKLSGDTNNGGTPGKINLAVLLIWKKSKGEWKLLARQATKI